VKRGDFISGLPRSRSSFSFVAPSISRAGGGAEVDLSRPRLDPNTKFGQKAHATPSKFGKIPPTEVGRRVTDATRAATDEDPIDPRFVSSPGPFDRFSPDKPLFTRGSSFDPDARPLVPRMRRAGGFSHSKDHT
jgi:hypothetical protein